MLSFRKLRSACKRFIDKLHEKKESKEYGMGTVVGQSWEEFEKFEKILKVVFFPGRRCR